MKEIATNRHAVLFILLLVTLLGGCASISDFSCDMHETQTRGTKPITTYTLTTLQGSSAPRTLPAGSVAQAPIYKITFKPGFTKPCTTLTLHKDVTIERSNEADVILNEIREFYAENGTLITTATQDISDQVKTSGNYIATTLLPIPKSAPPGKYKIVSKLMYERHGSRRPPILVSRAEGAFYIIPLE